ncbi:MAG: hypothetical protein P4M11_07575 [Candidatus Pacebacteria bacterium]|nr:hypothetical protein [Candidatus Paceibacterota bacterium]
MKKNLRWYLPQSLAFRDRGWNILTIRSGLSTDIEMIAERSQQSPSEPCLREV